MQISIHIAPTFLWAQPEPISKKIADIEATSAEHTEDVDGFFSKKMHYCYFTIPLCNSKSAHWSDMQDGSKGEEMGAQGDIWGREGV